MASMAPPEKEARAPARTKLSIKILLVLLVLALIVIGLQVVELSAGIELLPSGAVLVVLAAGIYAFAFAVGALSYWIVSLLRIRQRLVFWIPVASGAAAALVAISSILILLLPLAAPVDIGATVNGGAAPPKSQVPRFPEASDIVGHRDGVGPGLVPRDKRVRAKPPRPSTSAYWNTWFEYLERPAPAALTVGNTYVFVLDLSPYDYSKLQVAPVQSASVDPAVAEVLANTTRPTIAFQVRPILPEGGGLSFGPPIPADTLALTADLQRIREPAADPRLAPATGSLHEISLKVAAGRISFPVFAEAPGCTPVVLSILSEDGRMPLDHLVRWVSIANAGEQAPQCGSGDGGEIRSSGLASLLEVSVDVADSGTSKLADAAFHIFETAAGTFVVFSDGRPNVAHPIYAWQMDDDLISYVDDQNRLPLLIKQARQAAAGLKPDSYIPAAQELAAVLFSGKGSFDDRIAKSAKAAFQELVQQSASRPVIMARVVTDVRQGQNRSVFVPIGILGAKGQGAVLKRPITIIQPLPRESYRRPQSCLSDWTFGVPRKLENVAEDIDKLFPDTSRGTWYHDLTALKSYLSAFGEPEPAAAQGFLLLAHHGNGYLWFDNEAQRIIRQDIEREFLPGSIGIFAACAVAASPPGYEAGLIQRFNEHGVDAVIASPFPVPAEYGTRLAAEFPQALDDLRRVQGKVTVSDLFATVMERTAQRLTKDYGGTYEEMGLEYVLLGNPNITLCNGSVQGGMQ